MLEAAPATVARRPDPDPAQARSRAGPHLGLLPGPHTQRNKPVRARLNPRTKHTCASRRWPTGRHARLLPLAKPSPLASCCVGPAPEQLPTAGARARQHAAS
ncbi:hypothetical protein PR202_ga07125 [Eleusine coracana subsp. coracana]|uniref:Uncharacterized protein n=1 Tax=Eleusine coracana subsp. coracana TaxID=191504 RepID=A0AAV5BWU5_ELECO|nr:hypothetical protein PR202_ga07125 [Eleusine coracana subsp. coracana]